MKFHTPLTLGIAAAAGLVLSACANNSSSRQLQSTLVTAGKSLYGDSTSRTIPPTNPSARVNPIASPNAPPAAGGPQNSFIMVPGTPSMPLVAGQHWYGHYGCGPSRQTLMSRIETVGPNEPGTNRIKVTGVTFFTYHRGAANNKFRWFFGSFTIAGTYTPSTRLLILKPVAWIEQPTGFRALGTISDVSSDGTLITGDAINSVSTTCPSTSILSNGVDNNLPLPPQSRSPEQLRRELSENSRLEEIARVAALTPEQREAEKRKRAEQVAAWQAAMPVLVDAFLKMASQRAKQSEGCDQWGNCTQAQKDSFHDWARNNGATNYSY